MGFLDALGRASVLSILVSFSVAQAACGDDGNDGSGGAGGSASTTSTSGASSTSASGPATTSASSSGTATTSSGAGGDGGDGSGGGGGNGSGGDGSGGEGGGQPVSLVRCEAFDAYLEALAADVGCSDAEPDFFCGPISDSAVDGDCEGAVVAYFDCFEALIDAALDTCACDGEDLACVIEPSDCAAESEAFEACVGGPKT